MFNIKEKLQSLDKEVKKSVPKLVVDLDSKSGNVKSRVAALHDAKPAFPQRKIAPIRSRVKSRAAALNAKASISNQYSSKPNFTPLPRRKHSVKAIVSNVNTKKELIPDSPAVKFDFLGTKEVCCKVYFP